jgi:hypothetical protein
MGRGEALSPKNPEKKRPKFYPVSQVFNQARESLRLLEALEKGTLARAKTFVRLSKATEQKRMANEKLLSSLRRLGIAPQSEVNDLRMRIEKLEAELVQLTTPVNLVEEIPVRVKLTRPPVITESLPRS